MYTDYQLAIKKHTMKTRDKYAIAYSKWSRHTKDFRFYFIEKQSTLVGTVNISFTKHFIQRIVERAYDAREESTIRRMLYHTVNTRLCELLYWYYSTNSDDVMIRKDCNCIILNRGYDETSIIVRTFYKQNKNVKEENFFFIEL